MINNKHNQDEKGLRKRFNTQTALFSIFIIALLISTIGLTMYFIQSRQNRLNQEELANLHEKSLQVEQTQTPVCDTLAAMPTPRINASNVAVDTKSVNLVQKKAEDIFFRVIGLTREEFKPIVKRNEDTIGWISIEGVVDQPIVYRDNNFYLTHDFDKKNNKCGAIFLDVNHPLHASTQNLLLYGHNMKDETMFGKLAEYSKNNFLHANYKVTLETRYEKFTYIIFAVNQITLNVNASNFIYFWGHPTFENNEVFNNYINDIYERSLYTRFLDVNPSDTLLTLVTCVDKDRLILFARRQREDETDACIQKAILGLYMR